MSSPNHPSSLPTTPTLNNSQSTGYPPHQIFMSTGHPPCQEIHVYRPSILILRNSYPSTQYEFLVYRPSTLVRIIPLVYRPPTVYRLSIMSISIQYPPCSKIDPPGQIFKSTAHPLCPSSL